MTTRNLNKTWIDVITIQYKQDYSEKVDFPVKYLLYNPQHQADLFYEISERIDPVLFKKSLIDFHIYTRAHGYRQFEDENIKVWKRVRTAQANDETQVDSEPEQTQEPEQATSGTTTVNNPVKRRLQYVEQKLASRSAIAPTEP